MPPRFDVIAWLRKYGTTLFLALLMIFFACQNQRFISLRNLTNILTEGSIYGIIAVGMTFVILTAGVDLAVGSLLAFAGMAGAYVAQLIGADFSMSWIAALATSISVGAAAGYLQGRAVTLLGIPPFIVTLGGMTIWRGATLILHDGAPLSGFDQGYRWWGSGTMAHIPVPVVLFALVAATGYGVQRYTRYGRHVYAVGGNPEAARLNGLNVSGDRHQRLFGRRGAIGPRRLSAVRQARGRRSDRRHGLRTQSHRLGGDRRSEPVGRARRNRRHHRRSAAHRRTDQRSGHHARLLLLAAGGDRSYHRGSGGLRHLRKSRR